MSSEPISPSSLPPESCFRAPERLLQQRQRLEAGGDFLRAIDDFADADNDGNTVFGDGGAVRHFFLFLYPGGNSLAQPTFLVIADSEAKQSRLATRR